MKSVLTTNLGSTTTYFVGNHYEVANGVVTKYYFAGAQRVAMRSNGTLYFSLGDHLGSTSLVTFANGNVVSETRYKAWGEVRYSSAYAPTDYTYTGQYSNMGDFGLMFYNARWMDPALGRFIQADSITPPGIQGLDRYAYVNNSPMNYTDPSGHMCVSDDDKPIPCPQDTAPSLTRKGDKATTEDGKDFTRNFGGAEVYKIFLEYQRTCGWWNDDCNAYFGITEFLGVWTLFESNSDPQIAKVISTAIAQNLYVGGNNPATCTIGQCYRGVFNFMAAYSGGTGALFQGPHNAANQLYDRNVPRLGGASAIRSLISTLGSSALSSTSVVSWDRDSGPSNWGNVNGWARALRQNNMPEDQINGIAPSTVYYYINNAIFYSIDQKRYWANLDVDMSLAGNGETLP